MSTEKNAYDCLIHSRSGRGLCDKGSVPKGKGSIVHAQICCSCIWIGAMLVDVHPVTGRRVEIQSGEQWIRS